MDTILQKEESQRLKLNTLTHVSSPHLRHPEDKILFLFCHITHFLSCITPFSEEIKQAFRSGDLLAFLGAELEGFSQDIPNLLQRLVGFGRGDQVASAVD